MWEGPRAALPPQLPLEPWTCAALVSSRPHPPSPQPHPRRTRPWPQGHLPHWGAGVPPASSPSARSSPSVAKDGGRLVKTKLASQPPPPFSGHPIPTVHLGGRQAGGSPFQGPVQQHGAQGTAQVPRHDALLLQAAVVLQGQDDGVGGRLGSKSRLGGWPPLASPSSPPGRGHLEGVVPDGPQRVAEENLGGERVAVIDDGLLVGPVPAVQLQAAAAFAQRPAGTAGARTRGPAPARPEPRPRPRPWPTGCRLQCCWAR